MRLLEPWKKVETVVNIDLNALRSMGADTLLLDMDNTVVPWHTFDIDERIHSWILSAKAIGFKICIISNNKKWRIEKLAGMLGVHGVWNACKPLLGGYLRALARLGSSRHTSIFIGDQIFTDILGANLLGLKTILVNPISRRELAWTRLMRRVEASLAGRDLERKADEHGD